MIGDSKIRKGDLIASTDVTIRVPTGLLHYVRELLRSGLYGNTDEAAIERLLARTISDRVDSGELPAMTFDKHGNLLSTQRRR